MAERSVTHVVPALPRDRSDRHGNRQPIVTQGCTPVAAASSRTAGDTGTYLGARRDLAHRSDASTDRDPLRDRRSAVDRPQRSCVGYRAGVHRAGRLPTPASASARCASCSRPLRARILRGVARAAIRRGIGVQPAAIRRGIGVQRARCAAAVRDRVSRGVESASACGSARRSFRVGCSFRLRAATRAAVDAVDCING